MDQDFLFAIFAVQLGLVTPTAAMAAASGLLVDKSRSLPQRLRDEGAISEEQQRMLQGLVDQAVETHGGDVKKTLQTLGGEQALFRSFGGSLALDAQGDISLRPDDPPPSTTGDGESAAVTAEHEGRYTPRGGSIDAAEIGRGGLGRVMVVHDEHLGREVAIKELLEDAPGSSASPAPSGELSRTSALAARFLREARVTGQLEHPNIVPVYEVGQRADGTYYYAMRLVRGRTLSEALEPCRTLRDRLELLSRYVDLCHAIAYAHSRGVVHRDIKPDNVMIGEFGETVVVDWGLAKVRGKKDIRGKEIARELALYQEGGAGNTVDGSAIGTPAYMSPEQADGEIEAIDERSDVWSLGAVLYELLTGRPPFEGVTPFEIIGKVLKDEVEPPRQHDPQIPPELAAVAQKALHREKDGRYASARELAAEIEAFLSGGRIGAYAYSSWELVRAFVKRNRAASIAAAVVLVLVVVGGIMLQQAYRRAEQQRQRAEANEASAHARELQAELNLAQSLEATARRHFADKRLLEARIYAAASLLHNPANPKGPLHTEGFLAEHPASEELRVSAGAMVYQAGQSSLLRAEAIHKLEAPGQASAARVVWPRADQWGYVGTDRSVRLGSPAGGSTHKLTVEAGLTSLAAASKGRWWAAGDQSGLVHLWTDSSQSPTRRLGQQASAVMTLAFSPDDSMLAVAHEDGTVRNWSTADWSLLWSETLPVPGLFSLAFSPDSKLIAPGGNDTSLSLLDAASGRGVARWTGTGAGSMDLAFSPDGRWLARLTFGDSMEIWETESQRLVEELSLPTQTASVVFSLDGQLVATSSLDGTIRLWSTRTWSLVEAAKGHEGNLKAALSPDGRHLLSVGADGLARTWQLDRAPMARTLACDVKDATSIAVSPDGKTLAMGGHGLSVCLWDLAASTMRAKLPGEGLVVWALEFSPDGRALVAGGAETGPWIWDLSSQNRRELGLGITEADMPFLQEGRTLACAPYDKGPVHLVDVATGKTSRTLEGFKALAISPDERWLATTKKGEQTRLLVRELATGKLAHDRKANADQMWVARFSPDGRWLATGGMLGSLLVWDTKSYDEPRRFEGHQTWLNRMSYSPDGKLLATSSDDHTARIWSLQTGKTLLILRAGSIVGGIRFTPDGKSLAITDGPTVKLYPLDFSVWEQDAKSLLQHAEQAAGLRLEGVTLAQPK